MYNIENIRNKQGERIANSILLIHSFTGCDTTSRIFGVGKDRLIKTLDSVEDEIIDTFYSRDSSATEVKIAGERLLLFLLGHRVASLDIARHSTLEQKIQSSSIDIKS